MTRNPHFYIVKPRCWRIWNKNIHAVISAIVFAVAQELLTAKIIPD